MPRSHCSVISLVHGIPPAGLLASGVLEALDAELPGGLPVWRFGGAGQSGAGADGSSDQFRAIIELLDECVISKDLNGLITGWNKGATRLFGYEAGEVLGKPITLIIPPELHNEEPEILERIRRGEQVEPYETVRLHKDGRLVDISLSVTPIRNVQQEIVGAVKIARDISFQKKAERQLREQAGHLAQLNQALQQELQQRRKAEEAKELLLREAHHRIKNTLVTILAIASQTFRSASEGEHQAFTGRLQALARAHGRLMGSWEAADIRKVVELAVEPFRNSKPERIEVDGPLVTLDADKALNVALVLHELGTNAVKYGALSNHTGLVAIRWQRLEIGGKRVLNLSWTEIGGPPVTPPVRKGFGTTLIEHIVKGSNGRLEYQPAGLVCVLELPA